MYFFRYTSTNQRMDDQESDQRKADLDSEDDHICADFASEVNRKRAAKI